MLWLKNFLIVNRNKKSFNYLYAFEYIKIKLKTNDQK